MYAFVVLKKGVDVREADLTRQLNSMVSEKIAKYACPDFIQVILRFWLFLKGTQSPDWLYLVTSHSFGLCQFTKRLPKTRSGKIMRRVLRKVVDSDLEGLGDLSTLDDPAAVQEIIQGHEKLLSKRGP